MQKMIEPQKARQGRRGWRVLAVLVGGLLLAAIAWYAVETVVPDPADGPAASQPASAQPQTSN